MQEACKRAVFSQGICLPVKAFMFALVKFFLCDCAAYSSLTLDSPGNENPRPDPKPGKVIFLSRSSLSKKNPSTLRSSGPTRSSDKQSDRAKMDNFIFDG